jgi:hypothetical protein
MVNVLAIVLGLVLVLGVAAGLAATSVGSGITTSVSQAQKLTPRYWERAARQQTATHVWVELPRDPMWSPEWLPQSIRRQTAVTPRLASGLQEKSDTGPPFVEADRQLTANDDLNGWRVSSTGQVVGGSGFRSSQRG